MASEYKKDKKNSKIRILIVDDEPDLLRTTRYIVKGAGYDVDTAVDGEAALKKVRAQKPDLIVLDLMLPGMPGEEVCRQIKKDENTSGIPVIMLTAKNTDTDRIIGRVIGADCYMTKPFEIEKLLSEIKRLIEEKK